MVEQPIRNRQVAGSSPALGSSSSLQIVLYFPQIVCLFAFLSFFLANTLPALSQQKSGLQTYFKRDVSLSDEQIAAIRNGHAFAKHLRSRKADEIFVFGAVYIHADPEAYLRFSRDFDRMRTLPGFLALNRLSNPPRLAELRGFVFDKEDVQGLKNCRPGKCEVQLPAHHIEELQRSVNWSAPDAADQVNRFLQTTALDRVAAYQRDGNSALGVYNDKKDSASVAEQFEYMLSFAKALPDYLPSFHNYLLAYPADRPSNVEDDFYWANVKFGLKPTLRVVHVITFHGAAPSEPVYAIAEKQLYSSHYFRTALDLTFCVVEENADPHGGFYLIKVLGSEQAGLTGIRGSIVRMVAADRSASSLQKSLNAIKVALEKKQ